MKLLSNFQIKFSLIIFHKTALHIAIDNEYVEIVELLLSNENIDANIIQISNLNFNSIEIFIFKMIF